MTFPYDSSARKDAPGAYMMSLPIRSAAARPDTAGGQVSHPVAGSSRHAFHDSNLATQGGSSTNGLIPTEKAESTQDVAHRSRLTTRSISDARLPRVGDPHDLLRDLFERDIAALNHPDIPDPHEPDPLNDSMKPREADMEIPYMMFQRVQTQLATYQSVLPNLAAEAIAKHKAAAKEKVPRAEGEDEPDEEWVPLSAKDLGPKEQDTVKALLMRVEKLTDSLMYRYAEIWRYKRHSVNMHKAYNDMNDAYIAWGEKQDAEINNKDAELKNKDAEIAMLKQQLAEARGTITETKSELTQGEAMDVDKPQIYAKGSCKYGVACHNRFCMRPHPGRD